MPMTVDGLEAFAEFTEAIIRNSQEADAMKRYLPNAYKVYKNIVKDILRAVDEYKK